jgi:hypothetical protein
VSVKFVQIKALGQNWPRPGGARSLIFLIWCLNIYLKVMESFYIQGSDFRAIMALLFSLVSPLFKASHNLFQPTLFFLFSGPPTQRVKLMSTPVSKNWNFGKEGKIYYYV